MAGAAEGADLANVEQLLHRNMLFVSMDIDVNLKLLKKVLGPMFRFCRSIYFCSRNECVLDVVPKHKDTLETIKSYAGVNMDRTRQFKVRMDEADSLYTPDFFTDYAYALTTGKVPESLTPKFLVTNKEWLESRVRRDSDSSVSTYPLLTSEERGDESDITSINLNVTGEDVSSSRVESLQDQPTASEISDTEVNDPDTVVEPVDNPVGTSSSSEEEQDNTTLKKAEHATTAEGLRPPYQDVIPSICTPASPHSIDRPLDTDSIPGKDSKPPTPGNPFKQSDEQVLLGPPIPPLVPSAPPVMDLPETPDRITTSKSRLDLPTTPAGKTPLHKPRYTPSCPKQKLKKSKEPLTKKVVKESLKEVSNSGYSPHIMENPIEKKPKSSQQTKPLKLDPPLTIHSPPRRSYPIPDPCPSQNVERLPTPEQRIPSSEPSPKSVDINVQVVDLAIEQMKQEQLKDLIDTLIFRYEHKQRFGAMPPQDSSTHDQVFHLGGKEGVDGGCEEPELDIELEAQQQLSPILNKIPHLLHTIKINQHYSCQTLLSILETIQ